MKMVVLRPFLRVLILKSDVITDGWCGPTPRGPQKPFDCARSGKIKAGIMSPEYRLNKGPFMHKQKIAVLGAGTMGKQIALLFSSFGMSVKLWNHVDHPEINGELKRAALNQARLGVIIKDDLERILTRIEIVSDISQLANCSFFIEAVKENIDIKKSVLLKLKNIVSKDKIITTNTSTLSVTQLASLFDNPDRFVGMHFFNPVFSTKLVEVIRGEYTSEETLSTVTQLLDFLKKIYVILPETPGFVVNRLLFPMINEAVFLLSEGVEDAKTIDSCIKHGANHPMGPLELADFIGLDVCLSILETLVYETGDDKYRPAPLLRKLVRAGKLGRKSGVGFYSYRKI